ncbi:type II secretion system F family protein [Candidatus Omnitrophota bacterium]
MPKFTYKAKKNPVETIESTILAEDKTSAIQKLSSKGYYLVSLSEYKQSKNILKNRITIRRKITLKDIACFTRQLSDLLESGLTIVKSLDILHEQTGNKRLKEVILDVRNSCIGGETLSNALARHPRVFSNLFVSMTRSGETGGALEKVLKDLSDFTDKQLEIQIKIRSALAYPILMSIVGSVTIIVLLTFVIPKMMTMFSDLGQNLPLPTLFLINISSFIRNYWWLIASGIFSIAFIFARSYKTREGRRAIDRFKIKMPVFGDVIKKIELTRFARTLATLLHNGVPMLGALSIVAETVNNVVVKEEIKKASTAVREGSSLASGFYKSEVIPPLVINMIAVGEEASHIEKSLFKVVESYERETDASIKVMMSLLEPTLILFLGIIVGFIVLSMLLPIFEINFLIR